METKFDGTLRGLTFQQYNDPLQEETDDYRAIGSRSVISIVFGILSILTYFSWGFAFLPILGLVFGWLALQKIFTSQKEMTGLKLAIIGMVLSLGLGSFGMYWNHWTYYNVVPWGYVPLEISDFAADSKTGKVPDRILALDGQLVFVTGYMHPTRTMEGVTEFALVRTLHPDKFATATQSPTDTISVRMTNGQQLSYKIEPVKVGGILHVKKDFDYQNLPYSIEADTFR